jgi:microcompartment protein CcmL/EutN
MIEWDSLAVGLLASDALLKVADVLPLILRSVTPGRMVAVFTGDVVSVQMSLARGKAVGAEALYDELFLASPHPGLIPALGARTKTKEVASVGILETSSLCSAFYAADGAAKTGLVQLLEIRLGMGIGGKGLVVMTGEISQVESALSQGTALARERGRHLKSVVIPNPDPRFAEFIMDPQNPFSDFLI